MSKSAAFRRRAILGAAILVLSAIGAGLPALAAGPVSAARDSFPAGLPAGVAAAALAAEPNLPIPQGWSFPDQFSRTAGTGALVDGAFEWTDWVYDAFGAAGNCGSNSDLSSAVGCYAYPSGPADADGADIFRSGVGLTSTATVWRVDWNTLANPDVPIAEWTFDTDDNAATGGSQWPAGANVSSAGIEKALVVSAKGAELIDVVTGATLARYPTSVDTASQSFLVSVPRTELPVNGSWRIRLGSGLADAAGTGFAVPTDSGEGSVSSNAERLYNVAFRTAAQEPPGYSTSPDPAAGLEGDPVVGSYGVAGAISNAETANTWGEADQADTLASGSVSKFSQVIDWSQLAKKVTTPPPVVTGWSTRWYVTGLRLGQGIATGTMTQPQLLGRIQPYAVYVPSDYTANSALPLTWLLHGASENYTWAETDLPRLTAEACQDRNSICASPEGLGPVGYYIGDAELDFWQVWRQMALSFDLDPNRTVITGYSMGGVGAFILSATYPQVFSEAMPLDGSFDAGCNYIPTELASAGVPATDAEGTSFFTLPFAANRAANLHWVPMVVSSAYPDELSLYPHILIDAERYLAADDRFTVFSTTGGEHVVTLLEDGFSTQVAALHGTPLAATDPGTINYTWCPEVVDPALGLGPRHVYWISGLSERSTAATDTSTVVANDGAIPTAAETETEAESIVVPNDAPPMTETTGTWTTGATPAANETLDLTLTNVATVTVDTVGARLHQATTTVSTDGPTRVTLTGLTPGTIVSTLGKTWRVGSSGAIAVALPTGTSAVNWS